MTFLRRRIGLLIFLAFVATGIFIVFRLFGSNTSFTEDRKILYIKTGSSYSRVVSLLEKGGFVTNNRSFNRLAKLYNYDRQVLPGRYVIEKGSSIWNTLQLLRSGKQTPVNLVVGKLHTREELIQKIASNFEYSSEKVAAFFNSNDSLASYKLDTNTVMSMVIPGSYTILWTATFNEIFNELYRAKEAFWTADRKQKAAALGLTEQEVYTLASIVEEETNKEEDKGKIASVYLNRLNTGMKLGADPTVKFALKDFTLRRIYQKHLTVSSPYNTYLNKGLPPGPICSVKTNTIDAVLNAPATNYLYFVAKPEFDGYSNFAATYEEHLRYAKAYQQALDTLQMKRKMEGK